VPWIGLDVSRGETTKSRLADRHGVPSPTTLLWYRNSRVKIITESSVKIRLDYTTTSRPPLGVPN
jgi:hypothetical protein